MNKKVFLIGATGTIGKRLIPELLNMGYTVAGLTTSSIGGNYLETHEVKAYVGDILDADYMDYVIKDFEPDIVINQITSLKEGNFANNANVRTIGTRNIIDACVKYSVGKIISQSIAWAYKPGNELANEEEDLDVFSTEPRLTTVKGVYELENQSKRLKNHVILRYGFLYGENTWYAPNGFIHQQISAGMHRASEGIRSFIHIDDAISITIKSLEWNSGIYNVVNDVPVSEYEWAKYFCDKVGLKDIDIIAVAAQNWERGTSNSKIKNLGVLLKYPDWRDGYDN